MAKKQDVGNSDSLVDNRIFLHHKVSIPVVRTAKVRAAEQGVPLNVYLEDAIQNWNEKYTRKAK